MIRAFTTLSNALARRGERAWAQGQAVVLLALYRLAAMLVRIVPLWFSYWCACRIADVIFFAVWRDKRRVTIQNMRLVLGPSASPRTVRACARESVRNYAKYVVEFLRFASLRHRHILDALEITDWSRFDALRAEGRGVLFVAFHTGNWDLAGAAAGLRGYPLHVVADVVGPPLLNAEIQGIRRRQGIRLIEADHPAAAARALIKALRAGEMAGILIDVPAPDGVPVRLFGKTAYLPAGPATIALRTGARVVPTAVFRRPDNRFELLVDESFCYAPRGDREHDIRSLTQAMASALEALVRRQPEQWYIFRELWPVRATLTAPRSAPAAVGADA
ncbi:MAG: lysophospholipid acyltransferase family protein [Chloroflexota bacterium]|nr:lysophospholipid acyltransferase family protein [Dehalococcoidia bacterium]MDW8253296.1 lysophospholipid acyltransferase family protein [Chloroflexota bacterium]